MIYCLVEGHGEVAAIGNLLNRLWADLQLPLVPITEPRRWPNIHTDQGLARACEFARSRKDISGLLIIRDDEDHCPAEVAPQKSELIRSLNLNFPVGYHIMYREYETMFLAGISDIQGRPIVDKSGVSRNGIIGGTQYAGNPEDIRDAKGWLSNHFPEGRIYKPTVDQLPLTRMLSFQTLRTNALPCFGTLERCLRHLAVSVGTRSVYP